MSQILLGVSVRIVMACGNPDPDIDVEVDDPMKSFKEKK